MANVVGAVEKEFLSGMSKEMEESLSVVRKELKDKAESIHGPLPKHGYQGPTMSEEERAIAEKRHAEQQQSYDKFFSSDKLKDQLVYKRSDVMVDGPGGEKFNTSKATEAFHNMKSRYETQYNDLVDKGILRGQTQKTRNEYFKGLNSEETASNVKASKTYNAAAQRITSESNAENQLNAIKKYGNKGAPVAAKATQKVADDSAGAAVTNAAKDPSKLSQKMDGVLKKAVPVAVGGGLIFSMFNRGGQMSNSELYGQQPQYSGGY